MNQQLSTKLAHAGGHELGKQVAKSVSIPKVPPIYMSSVFNFDDVPTLDAVYDGSASGYVYSRISNPGYDFLHEIMATAEGAKHAVSFGSGMSAIITSILACVKAGDHIISSPVLYGAVFDYLKNEITRFGVEVDFVDFFKEDITSYIKPNTKVIYTETITNPLMEVVDLKSISDIAKKHDLKFIVDNTFATMSVCCPLEFGADVSVYSSTKYLGGHSDITGGMAFTNDDALGAQIQKLCTLYGPIPSPFDAWLMARSMRTLDIRMRQHCENAQAVAEYLEKHPKIERVYYPGLKSSEYHDVAMKQFRNGWCGGMLSADFIGGAKAVCDFIAASETIKFMPSLASYTTAVSYPVKTSHRAYSPEELESCGISPGQLRFSIGIEDPNDIIAEIEKAMASV